VKQVVFGVRFSFRLRQRAVMELYRESLFFCALAVRASLSRSVVASLARSWKTHKLPSLSVTCRLHVK